MQNRSLFAILLFFLATMFACLPVGWAAKLSTLKIVPSYMEIDMFFSGREVSLSGLIPHDRDIILEVIGPEQKSKFNMKGKVGPFWMTREKIELEHAPFLYKLLLPGDNKWHDMLSQLGIGITTLKKKLILKPENMSIDMIFNRFVRLKRSENLYGEEEDAIHYSRGTEGRKHFETRFSFPSSTVPGEYRIVAKVLHDGKIEETKIQSFEVEEVGLIKKVHDIAFRNGLVYGILCVFIALFFGGVIGLIFKRVEAH